MIKVPIHYFPYMSQDVPFVPTGGQSSNPLSKIFLTVNKHDDETDEEFITLFKQKLTSLKCAKCVQCTFQFERASRLHLHAAIRLRRSFRMRLLQLVRLCRESDKWAEGRPAREVKAQKVINWDAAVQYCTKDDTRVSGPHGDVPPPAPESWDLTVNDLPPLYSWQTAIVNTVTTPDPVLPHQWSSRTVFWLWENEGSIGKTMLLRYLVVVHGAVLLQGPPRHVKAVAYKNPSSLYVFPIPRAGHDPDLACIESIKDGIYMSHFGTEGTGMVCRRSPQILVLANRRCSNMDGLTRDRWCEVEINLSFRDACEHGKTRINISEDNEIINYGSFQL